MSTGSPRRRPGWRAGGAPHRVARVGLAVLALFAACAKPEGGLGDAAGDGPGGPSGAAAREELVVFAAASLSDVARALATAFEAAEPVRLVFNFAGSNTLAQQIDAAPGADLFLSADRRWVEFLEGRGRVEPGSRRELFSNRLVLIAHRRASYRLDDPAELPALGFRFLALADPEAVPAGRYARAHLERLAVPAGTSGGGSRGGASGGSVWQALAPRVVPALDVRAALALVEADPEAVGVIYRTDARTSPGVQVLYEFPPLADLPIAYWAVVVAGGPAPAAAERFLDYLSSPEALSIVERHGFVLEADETRGRDPAGAHRLEVPTAATQTAT